MKRALVLGAGFVAKPLLAELTADSALEVRLAALDVERARALAAVLPRIEPVGLDVEDEGALAAALEGADLVVSLLPAELHPPIARLCVARCLPLVTTSYISEAVRALDAPARTRGVLLLNETGLDPGIDHMLAAELVREVRAGGEEPVAYASVCGGLPAPGSADNPWRYKLSWTAAGVLHAARAPVRYLEEGRIVEAPGPFDPAGLRHVHIEGVGELEAFPNRDALPYLEPYGLRGARALYRGTLRYPGWAESLRALEALGLLDTGPVGEGAEKWADLTGRRLAPGREPLEERAAARLGLEPNHPVLERLRWLGLFADAPLPAVAPSPLDALARLLDERLRYAPGERDLVVLEHRLETRRPRGGGRRIVERLVTTGPAGDDSAMATTVGLPAALAARLILADEVPLTGVQIPTAPDLARPILRGLRVRGLPIERRDEAVD